jgi:probable F420-dependent oxidoreductase
MKVMPSGASRRAVAGWGMHIATTVPTDDLARSGELFARLEAIGYDAAFSFEAKHDPFLPLALASPATTTMGLGTAVAIGFARNPMVLANVGYDLQLLSEGRFVLGLGSQVRPHIQHRFSEPWSRPAARMRELVLAVRAIWNCWQTGAELQFEGDFYQHTLMTPAFDPGPNPHGPPPVFIGGFGPRMIEVAGEVADGLIVHPFNTRRSVEELVLPALARGRATANRDASAVKLVWVTMVVTWATDEEHAIAIGSVKDQLAFYGSTPAYAPVLELGGYDGLHIDLNAMSKQGRWTEMAKIIPDELVEEIAVVGPRSEIAEQISTRSAGITDRVSLVNNRNPDPDLFADIVEDLRALEQ